MKTIRGLFILIILLLVTVVQGQEPEDTVVYYSYELSQGEATSEGDTTYRAFILIDSLEVLKYEKLVILNENQEKVVTVKPKDMEKEKILTKVGSSYRIDLDRWSEVSGWIVFGEQSDKSKKYFKSLEKKEKQKVIHYPIPVMLAPLTDSAPVNPK